MHGMRAPVHYNEPPDTKLLDDAPLPAMSRIASPEGGAVTASDTGRHQLARRGKRTFWRDPMRSCGTIAASPCVGRFALGNSRGCGSERLALTLHCGPYPPAPTWSSTAARGPRGDRMTKCSSTALATRRHQRTLPLHTKRRLRSGRRPGDTWIGGHVECRHQAV